MRSRTCWPFGRTATLLLALLLLIILLCGAGTKPARARFDIYQYPAALIPQSSDDGVDYSQYAYAVHVTDRDYLCNALMVFEALHRLGSKAQRVLLFPNTMSPEDSSQFKELELLMKARKKYNVNLIPLPPLPWQAKPLDETGADSYAKLLAFNLTDYKRIITLNSDALVRQHMDELFLLPPAPVAMPRAYWAKAHDRALSSQLLLIEPSEKEFARTMDAIEHAGDNKYDVDILHNLYGDDKGAMILPHRPYDLVTGEFRRPGDHSAYLGSTEERFDADAILAEAKLVHFSDWPIAKPWILYDEVLMKKEQPKCTKHVDGRSPDCRARQVWRGLYEEFRHKRRQICGMGLSPAASKSVTNKAGKHP